MWLILVTVFFLCFKNVPFVHQGCIYLIKNTVKTIYSRDDEAEFSAAITPVFLVSHDPSEIILICWFGVQETFRGHTLF